MQNSNPGELASNGALAGPMDRRVNEEPGDVRGRRLSGAYGRFCGRKPEGGPAIEAHRLLPYGETLSVGRPLNK